MVRNLVRRVEDVKGWRDKRVVCERRFEQERRGEIAWCQAWKRVVNVRVSAD